MKLYLALLLAALCLAACGPGSYGPVQSDEGGALLAQATSVAARELSERKTATLQAATISAGQTRDLQSRIGTTTAQAIQQRQTEMAMNATANAASLQQQATLASATETSAARRSEATATANRLAVIAAETMQSRAVSQTETQSAVKAQASSTAYAATSTRSAFEIAVALERRQATATVEALERRREQAEQDAVRAAQWNDFFDTMMKILLGVGGLAVLTLGVITLARYLDSMAIRSRMVETRAGTVMIAHVNGRAHPILITAESGGFPLEDNFDNTQAPVIENEAPDLLKLTTSRGESFITKSDPEEEAREVRRKLAMRLLRESMVYLRSLSVDPGSVNKIPRYTEIGWSSETWVRAVDALKPHHVTTKPGRGGGTYCGSQFPTITQLYAALGERRIEVEGASPSPIAGRVSGST